MRLGLIGWSVRTGLGMMNRDLFDSGIVSSWLIPRHPLLGWEPSVVPQGGEPEVWRCERENDQTLYGRWLRQVDAVVFVETPYLQGYDLVGECRRRGIATLCVPMMEWLPLQSWVAGVDLMWAPTSWSARQLDVFAAQMERLKMPCRWAGRILGGAWGVDVERFRFRRRERCERFLFCNGNGGALGRKGAHVIAAAAELAPEVPILFRTQKPPEVKLPKNVEVRFENAAERWGIYDEGDVLLAPSRWEGLGLQLYEAAACGMPVITTDGGPMNECGAVSLIPFDRREMVSLCDRPFTAYEPCPAALADLLRRFHGTEIGPASAAARLRMEHRHDLRAVAANLRRELEAFVSKNPLKKSA